MAKGVRLGKEVVHKEWEACANFISDDYWRQRFDEMARGKMPAKCFYDSGTLSFWGKERDEVSFNTDDTKSMVSSAMKFLSKNCYINNKTTSRCKDRYMVIKEWSLCNDVTKHNLLERYVDIISMFAGMDESEKESLMGIINNGIRRKALTVVIRDSAIYDIKGLVWDEETGTYYVDYKVKVDKSKTTHVIPYKKTMGKRKLKKYESNWVKDIGRKYGGNK
uniref:Uncharacterized protein n=1 Tax=viral metagenome TaxID=1070528 RepID=A0A6C0JTK2_9ZZZZ